jgi:lysophospholipase L1-like esterase
MGEREVDGVRWRSFVAVGDSFTEGLDDPYRAVPGRRPAHRTRVVFRGWADLVAGALAAQAGELRYANLAIRGRLFDRVVDDQVPAALSMRPDLVSFAAGGNDILRRNFDATRLLARFDEVIAQVRATGADVLVFRFADLSVRLPGQRMIGPRVAALNRAVGDTVDRHGATLVDLSADAAFANPLLWSTDRLHLSSYGHRRVAAHVLAALGVEPDPQWWRVPPVPVPPAWLTARAADARWAGQHLAPWLKRRLTGRSSGDQVLPKRPTLGPVVAE